MTASTILLRPLWHAFSFALTANMVIVAIDTLALARYAPTFVTLTLLLGAWIGVQIARLVVPKGPTVTVRLGAPLPTPEPRSAPNAVGSLWRSEGLVYGTADAIVAGRILRAT